MINLKTFRLKKFYKKKSINGPHINKKFVYFPLHYQPERSSCPDGGYFSNQYLLLRTFRQYLDSNINIIIKEHPKQFQSKSVRNQSNRSLFFYSKLLSQENTFFLDYNYDTRDILLNPNLEGILTIRGNIIVEASLNNVPSFTFGATIWKDLPLIFDCNKISILENVNSYLRSNISNFPIKDDVLKSFKKIVNTGFVSNQTVFDKLNDIDQNRFNRYFINLLEVI
jgi:hypothetical protein